MKTMAHIFSTVFQPLLMPIYGIALLFVYTHFQYTYSRSFWQIMFPVFLFSFALPSISIFVMYKLKLVSDLSLSIRRERFIPYVMALLSYSFMIFHYYRIGMPSWFLMLTVAPIIVMIFAIIITIWWKISAHMFGVGSLVGGVMGVSYFVEQTNSSYLIMILFILSGFVGTSRLILRRHTPGQVYAGFLLGFVVTFACIGLGA